MSKVVGLGEVWNLPKVWNQTGEEMCMIFCENFDTRIRVSETQALNGDRSIQHSRS